MRVRREFDVMERATERLEKSMGAGEERKRKGRRWEMGDYILVEQL